MVQIKNFEVIKYCTECYLREVKTSRDRLLRSLDAFSLNKCNHIRGIDYSCFKTHSVAFGEFESDRFLVRKQKAEANLTDRLYESWNLLGNFKKTLAKLDNGNVIWLHYIEAQSMRNIAKIMIISKSEAFRRRDKALRELYYLMPEEYRRYTVPNAQIMEL